MSIIGSNILAGASGADTGFDPTTPIGTAIEGGYFAGFISHTANGVATHALIVAPAATGATGTGYSLSTNKKWQTSTSYVSATSLFDGYANTAKMTNSPAANFCTGLTIAGYSDWYVPARDELEIAYFNLKPTTTSNQTSVGVNDYSVPKRTSNYSSSNPAQTSVTAFRSGNSEAFQASRHWQSYEHTSAEAIVRGIEFSDGEQPGTFKTSALCVRAFRRVAL
jgi:hypothetical protein